MLVVFTGSQGSQCSGVIWIGGWMDRLADGLMDRGMDQWMDRQMDELMDRRIDRYIYKMRNFTKRTN